MSRFWRTRSRRHCLQTELSCCCCSQPAASSDRVLCLWDTVCHRSLDSEPAVFASLSATVSVCVQCTSCRVSCHVKLSTCLSHLFFPLFIMSIIINSSSHIPHISQEILICCLFFLCAASFSLTHPLHLSVLPLPTPSFFSFEDQLFLNTWTHCLSPPQAHPSPPPPFCLHDPSSPATL